MTVAMLVSGVQLEATDSRGATSVWILPMIGCVPSAASVKISSPKLIKTNYEILLCEAGFFSVMSS